MAFLVLGTGAAGLFAVALLRSRDHPARAAVPPPAQAVEKAPQTPPEAAPLPPKPKATPEQLQRADEARRKHADSLARDLTACLKRSDGSAVPGLLRALRPFGPIGIQAVEAELAATRDAPLRLGLQDALDKLRKP